MLNTLYRNLVATLLGFGALMVIMTLMAVRLSNEADLMETNQLMKTYSVREAMWLITGGLVFTLLASIMLVSMFTRPLRRLSAAMDRFEAGAIDGNSDATHAIPCPGHDEICRLENAFNHMANRIRNQVRDLRRMDDTRRELIVNISHDLRTPLASVQGHLETLLIKDGTLSADEERSYLEIATRETARLSKLIGKLFELAKLDAVEVELSPEPFSLPELVQDLTQKFNLAALNRKIVLSTDLAPKLPLVRGDIGLIERVLENLTENALRHTPEAGQVGIRLSAAAAGGIQVEVWDTGCGIPTAELPKIFERFYRLEKSRSDGSESAGLGLAIVKRILELHGSNATVESHIGAGTNFRFQLAPATNDVHQQSCCPAM